MGTWFDEDSSDIDLSALTLIGKDASEFIEIKAYDFEHKSTPGLYALEGRFIGFS